MGNTRKRFLVALSFPGEKRPFVKKVAAELTAVLGRDRVLYDEYWAAEFARPNLDLHLGRLYGQESELLVPFFCADYEKKEWCGLEWRQMRELRKQKKDEQIMPFRFDDAPISGVLSIDGYIKVGERSPKHVAKLILERLKECAAASVVGVPLPAEAAASASVSRLSSDAVKLLLAMAEAEDGGLLHSTTHSGYGITVGGRDFLPDTRSQRERAKWQRVIRELTAAGLITQDGPSGEIFVLTDQGYAVADLAKPGTGTTTLPTTATAFVPAEIKKVVPYFRSVDNVIADDPFGEGEAVEVEIPDRAAAFLSVHPAQRIDELPSALAARRLAVGKLVPMSAGPSGSNWSRNTMGAIAYSARTDGKVTNFTQLFTSCEICGVDLLVVQGTQRDRRVLDASRFELSCALALVNFVKFTRDSLGYLGPLRVMAGLEGIKGCKLGSGLRVVGKAVDDQLLWNEQLDNKGNSAEFLRPFFEKVWDSFGITRFPEADQHLATGLG